MIGFNHNLWPGLGSKAGELLDIPKMIKIMFR